MFETIVANLDVIVAAIGGIAVGAIAYAKLLVARLTEDELRDIYNKGTDFWKEYKKAKAIESADGPKLSPDEVLVLADKGAAFVQAIFKAIQLEDAVEFNYQKEKVTTIENEPLNNSEA